MLRVIECELDSPASESVPVLGFCKYYDAPLGYIKMGNFLTS